MLRLLRAKRQRVEKNGRAKNGGVQQRFGHCLKTFLEFAQKKPRSILENLLLKSSLRIRENGNINSSGSNGAIDNRALAMSRPRAFERLKNLSPFEVAQRCAHLPELIFFDSAVADNASAISIIAACPYEIVSGSSDADWQHLREKVRAHQLGDSTHLQDGMLRGFAAGFVEYDGAFRFGFYDSLLIYRHDENAWLEIGDFFSRLFAKNLPPSRAPQFSQSSNFRLDFQPTMTRENFCRMVERAQSYIAAGDIYQVNLSHQFIAALDEKNRGAENDESFDPLCFYEALRNCSPAPFAAFLRESTNDRNGRAVLSCSPESFLQISGSRIRTRPIKGTRPRRVDDSAADEKSARDLLTSKKEIAELVMITDLERNDLGQICEYGSVAVTELLKLERFAQVFHLVSTVEGQLRAEVDHVSALRAVFPGGSITGAPKKRAREIIAELEPAPRGLYTGAIGFFGFNGESRFSIAIRTAIVEKNRRVRCAHFHVGAGIVADSIPEMEYEETLHKAAGILLAAKRLSHEG